MSKYQISDILREPSVAYSGSNEMRLVEMARQGITKKSLFQLAEACALSIKDLASLLPVSLRTIQRYEDDDLLHPAVSEHALLIAELIAEANTVFQDEDLVQKWLHSPILGLGGITPFSLFDTGFGIRLVREELGRLEYGVYS